MIERLPPAERRAAHALLSRLKHDLGKYVAFQQRWLGDDPDPTELLDALRADLLATRRGPEGEVSAVDVWGAARPALLGERPVDGIHVDLRHDADVVELTAQVSELESWMPELRGDAPSAACLERCRALALNIADACRRLERRARSQET